MMGNPERYPEIPHSASAMALGNNVQNRPGWWRPGADGSRGQRARTADSLAVARAPWASSDAQEVGGRGGAKMNDQHEQCRSI